jgi:hypothetical protein
VTICFAGFFCDLNHRNVIGQKDRAFSAHYSPKSSILFHAGHYVIILRFLIVSALLTTVSSRRGAGAADRGGLENRCGGDSTQGSNPCPSAIRKEAGVWHLA